MGELPLQMPDRWLDSENALQQWCSFFFFFFTLVTEPRRSLSVKLRDKRVYAPQIRAHLGTTVHFCELNDDLSPRYAPPPRARPG